MILPPDVQAAWNRHDGPCALATVDQTGRPNVAFVSGVRALGDDIFVIADNYLHKTRANIQGGSAGALVFMTPERKSYQVKGRFTYHTGGPLFDFMKSWNPAKHPGHAAVAFRIEQVYCGSEQLR
jgi:predicted pyridoxine 5'-phosphate oxidase superfamily flavin-nucleotide-binding protein